MKKYSSLRYHPVPFNNVLINTNWIKTNLETAVCSLQCWSEIIETNAKNGVVFDATSNEQPI